MKTFEITFTRNPESGIYSANLINAESAEQAAAYFKSLGGYEVIGCTETQSRPKPGLPIHSVPEGWEGPEKENNMQIKTVFSAAKYLASMMKMCDDTEIQGIIIPAINPKGWAWKCDGKTPKECQDLGYSIVETWCIEIPQNENIDFWRNYSN